MALNLREIVAISGRGGLFRVISPARNGILVESLAEPKTRVLVPAQQQVSSLGDISLYTTTNDGTMPLADVLQAIHRTFGPQIALTAKSGPQELVTFIRQAVPEYDADRVYLSDLKKLVTWYNLLGPQLGEAATDAPAEEEATAPAAEALSTGGEVPAQSEAADADDKPVA